MPNIKIRVEKGTETAGDGQEQQEQKQSGQKEKLATASLFAHQMINTGKQAINYALTNVGNYTGDYVKQNSINQSLEVISDLTTIGMGFYTGGWVGGAIAILGVGTKITLSAISDFNEREKSTRQQDYIRARTGNSTRNGSRGTEN